MRRSGKNSSTTSPTIDAPLALRPRCLDPDPVAPPGDVAGAAISWRPPVPGAADAPGAATAGVEAIGPVLRRLEQFVLLERLGAGGMGTVYAAFDEKLERKVAIKLVATHPGNERAQQRLLREAQAQARLSHPNVVTIYEVGAMPEGGLFIAIELVKGETLRDWQNAEQTPRAWQDVVAKYAAAGEGLAAAHRVRITHRDFKPDNILVGDDGRVQVADFGLAFAARPDRADDGGATTVRDPSRPTSTPSSIPALTEAGSLTGTPGYIAPELFTGATADARSDQFSFCVALYEALHGERPYGDFTLIHEAPLPRRSEPDPSYPRWLWDVMMRGLALAPGDRFASMDALLGELTRNRARTHRVGTAAAVMGVLAIGAGAFALTRRDEPPACPVDPAALAGVWDPATKQQVRAALLGTGAPFAANVWASTDAAFDRYALRWTGARRAACEATHVQHTQSAELLDLRMECLAGHRRALAAAAEALLSRPRQAVGHAGEILSSLGDIELCADTSVLREIGAGRGKALTWALAARVRAEATEVRRRLARAKAMLATGDVAGAEPLIAEARQLAGNLDDEQVGAEVAYFEARIRLSHDDVAGSRTLFDRAIERATISRHDELVADIWLDRALTTGSREQRPADIASWLAQGEMWIRRLGHPSDSRRVQLERARGYLQLTEGDARAAVGSLSRALEIAELLWGKADPRLIPLLRNRATARGRLDQAAPALADAERALALGIAAWGLDYPDIAATRCVLGLLYIEQRDTIERGEHELTLALQLYRAQLGAESIDVAICEQALSKAGQYRGDYAAALEHAERAEQILARQLGANSTRHGEALNGVGALRFLRKDFTGSLAAYEAAYPILRDAFGPDHTTVGLLLSNRGETQLALANYKLAQADFTQAFDVLGRNPSAQDAYVAFPLKGLGLVQLARGQPGEALALLERALTVRTLSAAAGDPQELAEIRWGLARALIALGRDRARARTLAEAALAGYRGLLGSESAAHVQEISQWLATSAHTQ